MSLGMMGGAFNGNMYCIKTLIELIKATVAADSVWDVWGDWFPFFVVAFTITFAVSNGAEERTLLHSLSYNPPYNPPT